MAGRGGGSGGRGCEVHDLCATPPAAGRRDGATGGGGGDSEAERAAGACLHGQDKARQEPAAGELRH